MNDNHKKKHDEIEEEILEEEVVEEEHTEKKDKKKNRVEELEKEVEYLKDQLARAVADFRNLEKRRDEEKLEYIKYANRDLLIRLLPAFDMLFLAGKYVEDEGVKLTIKRIQDTFSEIGVEMIDAEGKDFDPSVMECVETQAGEEGHVLKQIKPGFTLHGKLLTPATVVVGKGEKESSN